MQCRSCGTQLAVGAAYCPTCGAVTPNNVSHSGISPYDPTVASSPSGAPLQAPPPATDYGAPPYGVLQQNPYEPFNPYEAPLRPPPPLPPRRFSARLAALLTGLVVLLIAASGVIYYATVFRPNQIHAQATGTAQAQIQQMANTNATRTAQTATAQTYATATTSAIAANPYGGGGTLALNNPLSDNSKGYRWAEFTSNSSACRFTAGAYEVDTPTHIFQACYATSSPQFSNFAFEIQMKIIKGDCGAILFRVDSTNDNFYDFEVCQDGRYEVDLHTGKASSPFKILVTLQSSSVIHSGLGQDNVLAVVANRNTFDLYVNHQKIDSMTDSTYNQGQIGVYGSSYFGDPTEVLFSNARVWTLG